MGDLNSGLKWVKLDLLSLFFINLESVTIVDCECNEAILTDIDLFIQKLQLDPNQKHRKKEDEKEHVEEDSIDKLAGIDIDVLVDALHNEQKSHISFKDPSFDDMCDYGQCKIREIKIIDSYDKKGKNGISDKKVKHF